MDWRKFCQILIVVLLGLTIVLLGKYFEGSLDCVTTYIGGFISLLGTMFLFFEILTKEN